MHTHQNESKMLSWSGQTTPSPCSWETTNSAKWNCVKPESFMNFLAVIALQEQLNILFFIKLSFLEAPSSDLLSEKNKKKMNGNILRYRSARGQRLPYICSDEGSLIRWSSKSVQSLAELRSLLTEYWLWCKTGLRHDHITVIILMWWSVWTGIK